MSIEVYCAVIYICVEKSSGMKLSFLLSKTVPRLELLGCLSLSQLIEEVVLTVTSGMCIDGIFCWNDSEVALCWVNGKKKCWKPCVENPVVAKF